MEFEVGQRVRIKQLTQSEIGGEEEELEEVGNLPLAPGRIGTVQEVDGDSVNVLLDGDKEMVSLDNGEVEGCSVEIALTDEAPNVTIKVGDFTYLIERWHEDEVGTLVVKLMETGGGFGGDKGTTILVGQPLDAGVTEEISSHEGIMITPDVA